MMMMVPEAWQGRAELPEELRDFYAYHSWLMEPWDGPAAVAFTDGRMIGATLDRNGLRPGRWVRDQGRLGRARPPRPACSGPRGRHRCAKGRLQPGKLFLVDLERGPHASPTARSRRDVAAQRPYGELVRASASCASRTCPSARRACRAPSRCAPRQLAFGCTPGGPAGAARPDGARRPPSRPARWATTSRWRCSPTAAAAVLLLQAALRAGHQPGRSTRSASRA